LSVLLKNDGAVTVPLYSCPLELIVPPTIISPLAVISPKNLALSLGPSAITKSPPQPSLLKINAS
jgi:hypothetical protein